MTDAFASSCSSCTTVLLATVVMAVLFLIRFCKRTMYPATAQPEILKVPIHHRKPFVGAALEFAPVKYLKTLIDFPTKYGPFVDCTSFGKRLLLVTDPAIIREVMQKRPKQFRRPEVPSTLITGTRNGLFESHGNLWGRLRRGMSPFFNQQNVRIKFRVVTEQVIEMIERLQALSPTFTTEQKEFSSTIVDMKLEATLLTTKVITLMAFAMPMEHPIHNYFFSEQFAEDTRAIFEYQSQRRLFPYPEIFWKMSSKYQYEVTAIESRKRWDRACIEVIDYKREQLRERLAAAESGKEAVEDAPASSNKRPALIDSLLLKQEENSPDALTSEELLSNVKVVYLAGSETTATAVTWVPYLFVQHPETQAKVRTEIAKFMSQHNLKAPRDIIGVMDVDNCTTDLTYCHAFGKELLRLYGPAPALMFVLEEGIPSLTLSNGLIIKAGDTIRTNHDGVHHLNVEAFPDPLKFNPDRWLTSDAQQLKTMEESFFPFGYGPRICPGMHLAMQEIVVSIAMLGFALDFALACPENEIYRVTNFSASASKMPIRVRTATANL